MEKDLSQATTSARMNFLKKYLPHIYAKIQEAWKNLSCDNEVQADKYLSFCKKWIDNYTVPIIGYKGFGVLFANAINKNEAGFEVTYCLGEHPNKTAILYESRLPWEISSRAKTMTADDMNNIFKKYLADIGIDAPVDWHSVERYD